MLLCGPVVESEQIADSDEPYDDQDDQQNQFHITPPVIGGRLAPQHNRPVGWLRPYYIQAKPEFDCSQRCIA